MMLDSCHAGLLWRHLLWRDGISIASTSCKGLESMATQTVPVKPTSIASGVQGVMIRRIKIPPSIPPLTQSKSGVEFVYDGNNNKIELVLRNWPLRH